ncbi:MAG: response regulator [Prolixibacteraceae bacterium]|nr:response regulator [Prolixibacteraceae bacterium]
MGQDQLFYNIPIPALIININNSRISPNKECNDLFGREINTIDDLNQLIVKGVDFGTIPQKKSKKFASIKHPTGITKQVEITYAGISNEELFVTFNEFQLNINQIFRNNDFLNIFNDAPVGIILKNIDFDETLYVSPYLLSKTGYSFEEIAALSWEELTYDEDIPKQKSLLEKLNNNSLDSYFLEKRLLSKTGKIYWFSEFVRIFQINNQKYQFVLLRDISVEKEIETELQRAKHKVEEAERLKSAFLDNLPHEIRTPLHAITGFTSLLSDSNLSVDERQEYVKFIQDSSNDILNLMDNIIEIAKLETNQVKPKKEKCYINSIFDKLLTDIESKQNILEKTDIEIRVNRGNPDPLFMIFSDPERIYQIISHLLNNALKFTEKGFIEFGFFLSNNNRIAFYVKDSGIGIPSNQQEIIFRKFGKSGNINTNKNRGTGLGLTLSKKLVELLNGEIKVESREGEGSAFTFHLPIEKEQKIYITKPSVYGDLNWSSKTILVAEDTESNYFFIEAFLERTKVNLLWAKDGNEAVKMYKENDINLILMDIMMPDKDGYDTTREIKEINSNIPIIAQTALALPDDEEKCYAAGCDYVLVKPINSDDLIATIKRFII